MGRLRRGGECFADCVGPGAGVGCLGEPCAGEEGHIDESLEASGEDGQAGGGGFGGGDSEAFGTAGDGDVGGDEEVGAGVQAVDGIWRELAEESEAGIVGGDGAQAGCFGPIANDGEGDIAGKLGQDVFGEPGDAFAFDEAAGGDDDLAGGGESERGAGGCWVCGALDAGETGGIDAVRDDARPEAESSFDDAGGGGADGDDAVGAEGAEGSTKEEAIAGDAPADILAVDGDECGGAPEELEEGCGEGEEAIAEVDGGDASAEGQAVPCGLCEEERQPALSAAEGAQLGWGGVVADELEGELFHAADGGREFSGDEEDHAVS